MSDSSFEGLVADSLRKANIPFVRNSPVGGLRADFLISTQDGKKLVLEAKDTNLTPNSFSRASNQVKLYKRATGAHSAAFVVPKGTKADPDKGIVSASKLVNYITERFGEGLELPKKEVAPSKNIFCVMPFAGIYEDTYYAMAGAAKSNGAVADKVDRDDFQGDIVAEVEKRIRGSAAVIADLSESKPNVLYEVGFSHALGRPTIHICSTPLDQLPFDVRNWNTLPYVLGQTKRLESALTPKVKSILTR